MDIQITPDFINPPKPGVSYGSVKAGANYYSVPVSLLGSFQKGVPASVEVETVHKGDKTYYNIKGLAKGGSQRPGVPENSPAPAPAQRYAPATPATPYGQARDIFITGIVGRAMGSGKFLPQDVVILALSAADAWDELRRRDGAGGDF